MPGAPICEGHGTATGNHIDLSSLVANSRRLTILGGPFIKLGRIVTSLQRWESPRINSAVLLLSNVACFCLSTAHLLLYFLLMLGSCASLGILHKRTGMLKKCFPTPPPSVESSSEDAQICKVQEFKDLLVKLNTFLEVTCCFLTHFYEILKWEKGYYSATCYAVLASSILSVNFLPLRCNINLAVTVFFLSHPISVYLESRTAPVCDDTEKALPPTSASETTSPSVSFVGPQAVSSSNESCEESDMLEDKLPEDDVSEQCADSSASADMSDGDGSAVKLAEAKEGTAKGSGVMGKLLDFKQRRHQKTSVGSCISCSVNFSAILKRRHKCSNCGNFFCGQCCSNRVPKSLLGVTAPGSQTLLVPVCQFCHKFLTASHGDN